MKFALAVIRLIDELPKVPAARHVAIQLFKAATSSGANYEEARGAESRDDFVHKLKVSSKEMRESMYWLRIVARSGWTERDLGAALREGHELVAILTASYHTARKRTR